MSEVIKIGDGLTRFTIQTADGEKTIALDLIEALQKYNAINKSCKDAGLDNYEYVAQFSEWVEQATGVKLIKAQAFQLIQAIDRNAGAIFGTGKADQLADATAVPAA